MQSLNRKIEENKKNIFLFDRKTSENNLAKPCESKEVKFIKKYYKLIDVYSE